MKISMKPVTDALQKAGTLLSENSPAILVGVTVVGVITTGVMATRATIRASEIIEDERLGRMNEENDWDSTELEPKEIVELTWRYYIPVVAVAGITIASAICSYRIQKNRGAALAALYSTSIKALEEYQAKAEEVVGKTKADKVREKIAEDKLAAHPVDPYNVIFTGLGDTLCYDVLSGRYFKHDIQKIQQARNDLNHRMMSENCLSLNDWYGLLELPSIGLGYDVGWNLDKLLEINFTSRLASDGTPCLVIDYISQPISTYRHCW